MNINGDKLLAVLWILGFLAAVYMIASNILFNKNFSYVAIGAGFISILPLLLKWIKAK